MGFEGKIAVVTGGSRGIGKAIAIELGRLGCIVAINYEHSQEKAAQVLEEIKDAKGEAIAIRGDVSTRMDVERLFKTVMEKFGRVDVLVNNAGIALNAPLLETTDELWDRTINVNLKGVFLCIQTAAKHMIPRKYGKIVNISSNSGFGVAVPGETAYAASKAGVIQLTKNTAYELGRYGINVNCVAPGATDTDMLKGEMTTEEYAKFLNDRRNKSSLATIVQPQDVASAVLFFASDNSRSITGRTLLVDGGRTDFL